MEINNRINALGAYQANTIKQEYKKTVAEEKKINTDKVEFSKSALSAIDAAKASAARNAEAGASPERISALKSSIENGSYRISAESIASAILGADL